jgi:hypothetical protein
VPDVLNQVVPWSDTNVSIVIAGIHPTDIRRRYPARKVVSKFSITLEIRNSLIRTRNAIVDR